MTKIILERIKINKIKGKSKMKNKIDSEFEEIIKRLRKIKRLIKKVNFCNVTEGHLLKEYSDLIDTLKREKEQFRYFYYQEKEKKGNFKVIV